MLLVVVATLGAWTFTAIPAIAIGDDDATAKVAGNAISLLLTAVVFVAVPIFVLRAMGTSLTPGGLGLHVPQRRWRALGVIVGGYVAFALLAQLVGWAIDIGDTQDDVPVKLGAAETVLAGVVLGLCTSILAPIGEEFFLRGVVYPGLREGFGRFVPRGTAIALAAVLNGVLFGVLHGATDPIFIPILALFGAVLCITYQLTGSLYVPILIHATNNAIAMAVSLDWPVGRAVAVWVAAVTVISLLALALRGWERRLLPG